MSLGYQSPILQSLGVFEASGPDAGVAAHYGEPLKEQRRLVWGDQKFVVADYSHWGIVTVAGPDRHSWMTTLSSQVVDPMQAGDSAELTLLSPQGRIEYVPLVVEDGEKLWLIVESDQAEPLTEYLQRMKFMLRVEITNVSDQFATVVSTADPRTAENAPAELKEAVVWQDPWPNIAPGGTSYSAVPDAEHPGYDFQRFVSIISRENLLKIAPAVSWAGIWAAEALRIEAWRPRFANEVDAKSIPHELDLMRTAVHLSKGCYKGQETVARVHNLGHPPRRLVFLDLDGSEHTMPAVGANVLNGTKKVGYVTSVAQHWEAGPIALALVKRNVDPQAQLTVVEEPQDSEESSTATPAQYSALQTVIVSPEAGQAAGRRHMGDFLRR
ncbi:MAG: folate-binding protein [Rothia sp. (in: high G+C Gram-positive bacteria)]|nr:folate-binding protein [Rothia sp. (in: high G+C Gram-positive bacteria)]